MHMLINPRRHTVTLLCSLRGSLGHFSDSVQLRAVLPTMQWWRALCEGPLFQSWSISERVSQTRPRLIQISLSQARLTSWPIKYLPVFLLLVLRCGGYNGGWNSSFPLSLPWSNSHPCRRQLMISIITQSPEHLITSSGSLWCRRAGVMERAFCAHNWL